MVVLRSKGCGSSEKFRRPRYRLRIAPRFMTGRTMSCRVSLMVKSRVGVKLLMLLLLLLLLLQC